MFNIFEISIERLRDPVYFIPMLSQSRASFPSADPKQSHFKVAAEHALVFVRQIPGFLKSCYFDGTRAIIAGRYSRRQGVLIIAAMLPILLTTAVITVPLVLFPTEGHKAYFQFASILNTDPASLVPLLIGSVTATLGLKVPVG